MYKCSKCRKDMLGIPALKNNAGEFCVDCKAEIHKKSLEGQRLRKKAWDRKCLWCKVDINKGENKVCDKCQSNREWLLHCIRLTERPFKYISRVEEKERNGRIDRLKQLDDENQRAIKEAEKPKQIDIYSALSGKESNNDKRIDKIESLLLKLIENLGGVN